MKQFTAYIQISDKSRGNEFSQHESIGALLTAKKKAFRLLKL